MFDDKTNRLLDKIVKALELEKSARELGNTGEADAALSRVAALITAANITMNDVENYRARETDPMRFETVDPWEGMKRRERKEWHLSLATIVSQAFFCKFLVYPRTNRYIFIGRDSNRQSAIYTFSYLIWELDQGQDKAYRSAYHKAKGDQKLIEELKGFRAAWTHGALWSINQRLEAGKSQAVKEANVPQSTAMVRVERAQQEVEDYFQKIVEDNAIRVVDESSKPTRIKSLRALDAGIDFGATVPLNKPLETSDQRLLPN